MAKALSWGEALDYTIKTKWFESPSIKTNLINTGHFTKCHGRSFPVSRIDQVIMDLFIADLREERGIRNATINRCVTAVGTVINHCAKRKMCNPAPVFDKLDETIGWRIFWFTQDEVDRISYAALDPFYRQEISDIILTAAYTGMRQGELLKIKVRDIDLSLKKIHVGGLPDVLTKAKNYRCIPIHSRLFSLLQRRLEHASPSTRVFDDVGDKDQLLKAFKKARDYASAPSYVFHDLRHSFGTWHATAGTPMRTLMGLMGHKRIETTLRYAHQTDKAKETAMDAI